jgi:DNA-binding NtrC family response regulator
LIYDIFDGGNTVGLMPYSARTVFRLIFLLRPVKNNEIQQTGELASAPTRCQANPDNRVLVVDDDVDISQVHAEVLSRFGYQAETAADGAAAWEALPADGYDLLITDNNMPKVSGVEPVKKVRSAQMTLSVILASGALPTEELDRNPWLQPVVTLVKPFSSGQLLETVNEILAQPAVSAAHREMLPAGTKGAKRLREV